jgi:hypothetical protein
LEAEALALCRMLERNFSPLICQRTRVAPDDSDQEDYRVGASRVAPGVTGGVSAKRFRAAPDRTLHCGSGSTDARSPSTPSSSPLVIPSENPSSRRSQDAGLEAFEFVACMQKQPCAGEVGILVAKGAEASRIGDAWVGGRLHLDRRPPPDELIRRLEQVQIAVNDE